MVQNSLLFYTMSLLMLADNVTACYLFFRSGGTVQHLLLCYLLPRACGVAQFSSIPAVLSSCAVVM